MTEEVIEKYAEEYANKVCSYEKAQIFEYVKDAFKEGADFTWYSNNAELKEENEQLKAQIEELKKINKKLYKVNVKDYCELQKQNKELKEQIEKMKCCGNCKYRVCDECGEFCDYKGISGVSGNCDVWELKE